MKVIAYPCAGIAYLDSFYAALRDRGYGVVAGEWSGRWIWSNFERGDVAHFHWPSFYYDAEGSIPAILLSFSRFVALILLIRMKGAKVVWTAHNLYPHDPARFKITHRLGRRFVIAVSAHIFAHSEQALNVLADEFAGLRHKCDIIPHGHWIGRYGPMIGRSSARERLGIDDKQFVYLMFGQCKPYKNIVNLVRVFGELSLPDSKLLIAGRFSSDEYKRQVEDAAAGNPNVIIRSEFIPDKDVPMYFGAANIMCMPYQEILTSGTAMLSISYGRPVLSIDRGFLHDVVTESIGLLTEQGDSDALEESMHQARARPWDESEILRHAELFTFDDAATIFGETVSSARNSAT